MAAEEFSTDAFRRLLVARFGCTAEAWRRLFADAVAVPCDHFVSACVSSGLVSQEHAAWVFTAVAEEECSLELLDPVGATAWADFRLKVFRHFGSLANARRALTAANVRGDPAGISRTALVAVCSQVSVDAQAVLMHVGTGPRVSGWIDPAHQTDRSLRAPPRTRACGPRVPPRETARLARVAVRHGEHMVSRPARSACGPRDKDLLGPRLATARETGVFPRALRPRASGIPLPGDMEREEYGRTPSPSRGRTPSPSRLAEVPHRDSPDRISDRHAAHRDATMRSAGLPLAPHMAASLWSSRYAFATEGFDHFSAERRKAAEVLFKEHHVAQTRHMAEEDEVRATAMKLSASLPNLNADLEEDAAGGVEPRPMLSAFLAVTDAVPRIRRSTLAWGIREVYFSMRLLHAAPDLVVWTDCLHEVQIEVVLTFSVFGRGSHKCVDEVSRFLTPQDTSCGPLRALAHFLTPVPQSWGTLQNGYMFFALAGHPPKNWSVQHEHDTPDDRSLDYRVY